jgi:DNA-binding XRE family transcriptional regulator
MTAPPEVPEVLLCGKVLVRKARGPGWVVGEPHGRTDGGRNLLRPAYYGTPDAALTSGLYRAQKLCPTLYPQRLLAAFLDGIPNASGPFPAWGLTDPGAWLRTMRREAGLTQRRLAERSGVSARQIRRIETGNVNPRGRTLARLIGGVTDE